MALRIVYLGTPQFAVPTLEAIIAAGHQVLEVITQPDRPKGRQQTLTPSKPQRWPTTCPSISRSASAEPNPSTICVS
jgi:methionyl-tRNA formyltransferase